METLTIKTKKESNHLYELFEEKVINSLYQKYKLTVEEACFAKGWIPKHIILDRTRNIHSYIVFADYSNKVFKGRYFQSISSFQEDVIELVKIQYSKLDRPLFILYKHEDGAIYCIESNEIREHILNNRQVEISEYIVNASVNFDNIVDTIKTQL